MFPALPVANRALPGRLFALCLFLTLAVFLADFLAPTDIIFSLAYAVPLFLCARTSDVRILWSVALLAAVFNCAAYAWGVPPALTLDNVTLNRALSALQILVIAGLLHLVSKQARRLEELNQLAQAVLQQMPAGVVISEAPSGIVRLVNEYAAALWRDPAQPERPAFKNGTRPLHGGGLEASTTLPLAQSIRTGATVTAQEIEVVRADRTPGVIRAFSAPVRDRDSHIIAAVMTFADITGLKRIEHEREDLLARECAARAEAEAANRTRDEFFATLSHELRAPLNTVRLWLDLLRTGKLSREKSARAMELIDDKVALQARLIDDLLDVSRIMFRKLTLEVSTVDLTGFIQSIVEALRPSAEAKNLSLAVICDADNLVARVDVVRLQQIVANLVLNAIKFTPDGGNITVELRRQGAEAEISIADSGEGIPADFLPHVFEGFQQAERVSARRHDGLGLGLKIVRHLVELHGGTIAAESAGIGQGARFAVKLPLVAIAAARQTAKVEPREPAEATSTTALCGVRALIVDDDSAVRDALVILLERHGASTVEVGSAAAAMNVLMRERIDVLLTDIAMPAEDGYTLLRRVRALPSKGGGSVPAVAITAHAEAADRTRVLAAGFAAHFPKPPDAARLVAVVASLAHAKPTV